MNIVATWVACYCSSMCPQQALRCSGGPSCNGGASSRNVPHLRRYNFKLRGRLQRWEKIGSRVQVTSSKKEKNLSKHLKTSKYHRIKCENGPTVPKSDEDNFTLQSSLARSSHKLSTGSESLNDVFSYLNSHCTEARKVLLSSRFLRQGSDQGSRFSHESVLFSGKFQPLSREISPFSPFCGSPRIMWSHF